VAVGERCLPAKMRRRLDVETFVRNSRRDFRVEIVVVAGSESGIVLPATSLTKMEMLSSAAAASAEVADDSDVMLLERMSDCMIAELVILWRSNFDM